MLDALAGRSVERIRDVHTMAFDFKPTECDAGAPVIVGTKNLQVQLDLEE